jgi:hypothetical protein
MKQLILFLAACLFITAAVTATAGGETETIVEEKIVIALSTDDFEMEETDLSHLSVGDAETIITESGKTIDLLRTEDGIEIYVDGEMLDISAHQENTFVHKKIEIICDDDEEECEELVWISEDGDVDLESLHDGDHKVIMIHSDEEHGEMDVDVEVLHDGHATAHKVIKIKHGEPGDLHELHEAHGEKVIVIKKKVIEEEI